MSLGMGTLKLGGLLSLHNGPRVRRGHSSFSWE